MFCSPLKSQLKIDTNLKNLQTFIIIPMLTCSQKHLKHRKGISLRSHFKGFEFKKYVLVG